MEHVTSAQGISRLRKVGGRTRPGRLRHQGATVSHWDASSAWASALPLAQAGQFSTAPGQIQPITFARAGATQPDDTGASA